MPKRPTKQEVEASKTMPSGHDLLEIIVNETPVLAEWCAANGCGEFVEEN